MEALSGQLDAYLRAASRAAWAEALRRKRNGELDRSVKALAKCVAKSATAQVADRRLRQDSRTRLYNDLVPVFRHLGETQVRIRRQNRYLAGAFGLAAVCAVAGMLLL